MVRGISSYLHTTFSHLRSTFVIRGLPHLSWGLFVCPAAGSLPRSWVTKRTAREGLFPDCVGRSEGQGKVQSWTPVITARYFWEVQTDTNIKYEIFWYPSPTTPHWDIKSLFVYGVMLARNAPGPLSHKDWKVSYCFDCHLDWSFLTGLFSNIES